MTNKPKTKPPGRPQSLPDGKRLNVYLDAATIDKATKIGKGNLSAGLRKAVAKHQQEKK